MSCWMYVVRLDGAKGLQHNRLPCINGIAAPTSVCVCVCVCVHVTLRIKRPLFQFVYDLSSTSVRWLQ